MANFFQLNDLLPLALNEYALAAERFLTDQFNKPPGKEVFVGYTMDWTGSCRKVKIKKQFNSSLY
jgi:hypothetical protein